MGTYPLKIRVALEELLVRQHDIKVNLRRLRRRIVRSPKLKSVWRIASELGVSEAYVRNFAHDRKLDPFPERDGRGAMWTACYMVTHLGYSIKQASKATGFKEASISNNLRLNGWRLFKVWGNVRCKNSQQRPLVIPPRVSSTMTVKQGIRGLEDIYEETDFTKLRKTFFLERG